MPVVHLSPLRLAGFGLVAAAVGVLAPASAIADPQPGCTAADMANVAAGVAASTSGYLHAHPDVNAFYTELRDRPDDEVPEAIRGYFADNPQAHADLRGLRQPLVEFRNRCGVADPGHPLLDQ
ncbi:heme-binding protein [[Mycobacterium] kokjensenii]|uniref:Heme-binding protein n=1 Tax=[Mycobacterium] kokjensenii TaxID=3064287 RepID=A0ABM9L8R8_9MYCO|nr:heme-binding protein [Mycolicibacter sp. MU0083]CAJ1494751.1 heme-binding protein [Mycolicibacter sp. MU0083]